MWKRISSVIARSKRARRNTTSAIRRTRVNTSHLVRRGGQRRGDGRSEPVPARGLLFQAPAARGREPVVLRLSLVLTFAPLGFDESLMLEAVECWIEGTLRDVQRVFRD